MTERHYMQARTVPLRVLWRELLHRWPCITAVLRGSTVVYNAQIGPPGDALLTIRRSGSVVMDSIFIASGPEGNDVGVRS